jgi:hypothetical protein
MQYLPGKKIILSLALGLSIATALFSQVKTRENLNYLDFQNKRFYFGMALGINSGKFVVNQSKNLIGNPSINTVESSSKNGFNVHMITNMKMGENFDFRVNPGFSFNYRSLLFNDQQDRIIESVFFEVPIGIRFKSAPYKDKRAFVSANIKYGYDVSSNSRSRRTENVLKVAPHDYQWEVGVGMQFFYPFFIFSPELKLSRAINNSLIYNGALQESNVIESMNSQFVTLTFNFEG